MPREPPVMRTWRGRVEAMRVRDQLTLRRVILLWKSRPFVFGVGIRSSVDVGEVVGAMKLDELDA